MLRLARAFTRDAPREPRVDSTASGIACRSMPHSGLHRGGGGTTRWGPPRRLDGERRPIVRDWRSRPGGIYWRTC